MYNFNKEIFTILRDFNTEFNESTVNSILNNGIANKGTIKTILEKHPNWNYKDMLIQKPMTVKITANDNDAVYYLKQAIGYATGVNLNWSSSETGELYYNLAKTLIHEQLTDENVELFKGIGFKARKGQKTTRAVNAWLEPIAKIRETIPEQEGSLRLYNQYFANYSDEMKFTDEQIVINYSINPIDYFTMSHGNSWSSCHSIKNDGCYKAGTISLLLDNCTVVAYVQNADGDKICRMLIYVHEYSVMACRCYGGVNCEAYKESIFNDFIEVLRDCGTIIDDNTNKNYYYYYNKDYVSCYPDYEGWDNRIQTINNAPDIERRNWIGEPALCLICGSINRNEESLVCDDCQSEIAVCEWCGVRHDIDDMVWLDSRDGWYCTDCVTQCSECGDWYLDSYINDGMCATCHSRFVECEYCGTLIEYDDSRYSETEDSYYCNSCYDERFDGTDEA